VLLYLRRLESAGGFLSDDESPEGEMLALARLHGLIHIGSGWDCGIRITDAGEDFLARLGWS
jgi:hypothetical protein